jgi:hypothetical protein
MGEVFRRFRSRRLLHHAVVIQIEGSSYRLRQYADLMPEHVRSKAKLKHFLRKTAARTVEAVCLAIGETLQLFTPAECASYLANSGYRRT